MSGKFITLILAASVAVTGLSAAPAKAADRDLAIALATVAGVAVIGAAIHDSKKNKRRAAAHTHARPVYGAHHRRHVAQRKNFKPHRGYHPGRKAHHRHTHDHRAVRHSHRGHSRPQHGYSGRPYRHAN
ncbi:MAG: hypothetical protein Q4P24_13525 [Rhodobacterales bacterium]|nr:hypothetical protein [Rhodobacterales bacterium]